MGNDIINNGYGVYLYYYCDDNTIKNNYIADSNSHGIYLYYYSDYNTIVDNTVTRNSNGIYLLQHNNHNTIANNSFNSNDNPGIYLYSSGNSELINNTVASNKGDGIYLSGSADTIIKENSVDLNKGGIYLYSTSKNCEITENNITHSSDYGLYLHSGSSLNKIYHNNFISNTKQAEEDESSNSFDSGPTTGGNYWSDHVCTGNPSNGSQPYIIPPYGHKDRYPFENINGWMVEDITPPASITNLQNTTGPTWIKWTWTNPPDSDFSHVMAYLNGTWQTNTSNPFYNATGLIPDTYYELGTHTVDKVGNVNMTWVNQMTKTGPDIPNQPPIASFFYSPQNPVVNQTITFNASSSHDPDGTIIKYDWNFGDGNITNLTEQIITHSFASAGGYNVNLTVTDNDGATNSTSQVITVTEAPQGNDWGIKLEVTSGAGTDIAEFGLNAAATDGFDAEFDVPEAPPPPPPYQQACFYYPENPLVKKLSTSYIPHHFVDSQELNTWPFQLDYNGEASEVTITWNATDIAAVPTNYSLLFGVDGEKIYMRTTPSYTFSATTGTYEFEIRATTGGEKPDLVITEMYETFVDDRNFNITYMVNNTGCADAGPSNTTIYIDGDPLEVPTQAIPKYECYENIVGPFECPCGEILNVTVCADNGNVINESNETNNCEVNIIECPPPRPGIEVNKTVWDKESQSWVDETTAQISEIVRFRCEMHNNGTCCPLTNLVVTDTLSDGLEYADNVTIYLPEGIIPPEGIIYLIEPFRVGGTYVWKFPNLVLVPCDTITIEFDAHVIKSGRDWNRQNATAGGCGKIVSDEDYAYVNVPITEKPDLTVTEITVNYDAPGLGGRAIGPEPGEGVHTECNNISARIEEVDGVSVVSPFDVSFEIDGEQKCSVRVPELTGGSNKRVYCNGSWYPMAGDDFAIMVTADSKHVIPETNETDNTKWNNGTVVSNGYKGNGWQGPDMNLENVQCHDQDTINLIYSVGDSYYLSGAKQWTKYTANWAANDLPVPEFTNVEEAAYIETDEFNAAGNNKAELTKSVATDEVSMTGMLLMVVYKHPDEPEWIICIDDGFDMLYANENYAVSSEEATTYAPFTCCEPIQIEEIVNAILIAVAPNAADGDYKNRLSFNDGLWNGVWDHYEGATELGIAETNVLAHLQVRDNVANFQSHIPAGGTKGDFMEASNAFLILEKRGEPEEPNADTNIEPTQ